MIQWPCDHHIMKAYYFRAHMNIFQTLYHYINPFCSFQQLPEWRYKKCDDAAWCLSEIKQLTLDGEIVHVMLCFGVDHKVACCIGDASCRLFIGGSRAGRIFHHQGAAESIATCHLDVNKGNRSIQTSIVAHCYYTTLPYHSSIYI